MPEEWGFPVARIPLVPSQRRVTGNFENTKPLEPKARELLASLASASADLAPRQSSKHRLQSMSAGAPAAAPPPSRIAVMGGSGLSSSALFATLPRVVVNGEVTVYADERLVFVKRHHAALDEAYAPPHLIDHRAIWRALRALNVTRVLGVCSVGTLRPALFRVGALLVADDWFAPYSLPVSMRPDAHYKPTLDSSLRREVLAALKKDAKTQARLVEASAVYAQTHGPRFETPAEVRALARDADVVGMTAASEAGLACELGIAYAMMCMVDNVGNGLDPNGSSTLASMEAFKAAQKSNLDLVEHAVSLVVDRMLVGGGMSATKRSRQISELPVKTLIRAGYVATVDSNDQVIQHGIVAVGEDGVIVGVHSASDCPLYTASEIVDLPDSIVIPGLINAHTHVGMTLMRGFGDDMALMDWLVTRIWPTEAKLASPDFVFDSTTMASREMLLSGTTCFLEMYFFPQATERAVVEAGMRAVVGLVVIDFPTPMATGGDDCLAQAKAKLDAGPSSPLITYAVSPHAPYSVSEEHIVQSKTLAAESKRVFSTHLHETSDEVEASCCLNTKSSFCHKASAACRPLANLSRLGVVGNDCVFAHMVHCDDADIDTLSAKGTSVAHCATSNMKLASGFCPVAKMLQKGVNVCLGTDGAVSNNSLDMMAEMKLACVMAKGVAGDATAITCTQALRMATINGAKALGLSDVVGSIEAGKHADLVAVELREHCKPVYDPVSALVYAATRECVTHVWVDGVPRVWNGALVGGPRMKNSPEEWSKKVMAVREELEER